MYETVKHATNSSRSQILKGIEKCGDFKGNNTTKYTFCSTYQKVKT